MLGIPLGLMVANASEWVIHKYVLHEMGRDKKSFWAFHWHDHHGNSRKEGFKDAHYETRLFAKGWNGQSKEAVLVALGAATQLPLLPIAPFYTGAIIYSAINYYIKHKKAHLDPEWAREHLPWHYDHHMGPNQHANWCVTRPWMDELMGTREPYVGTEREREDIAKRERLQARKAARKKQAEAAGVRRSEPALAAQ